MSGKRSLFFLAVLWLGIVVFSAPTCEPPMRQLYIIETPQRVPGGVPALTRGAGIDWWVDLGEALLVAGDTRFERRLVARGQSFSVRSLPDREDRLFLIGSKHSGVRREGGEVLFAGRTFQVIARSDSAPLPKGVRARVLPRNRSLFSPAARKALDFSPAIDPVVAEVSEASIAAFLEGLAQFPTRFTYAPDFPAVGNYLAQEMADLGLEPQLDPFHIDVQTFHNVIARIPGSVTPERIYVVGAHYDSISDDPYNHAPGGDDNASGVAGLLEIGRILATLDLPETVILAAFGGEEEGLYGSTDLVHDLRASGEIGDVAAMLNFDMIGYLDDDVHDVLLESESFASDEVDLLSAAAARYTDLTTYVSFYAFGSDHVPFLDAGVPAVLSIEYGYENNPYYHQTNDTIDHVSVPLVAEIVKMNLATLLQWMNYGESGGGTSGESSGTTGGSSLTTAGESGGTTGATETTPATDDGDHGHGCGVLPHPTPFGGILLLPPLLLLLRRKDLSPAHRASV